ncbi:hypothetical protein GCM10011362_17180 [Marinobacter halophilus]|nr:hypothetical protein GCM10011362_17180 [Marinobacter halophilus]
MQPVQHGHTLADHLQQLTSEGLQFGRQFGKGFLSKSLMLTRNVRLSDQFGFVDIERKHAAECTPALQAQKKRL